MGICVLCNNLIGKRFILDDKPIDGCVCSKGKFQKGGIESVYTIENVTRQSKTIKEIQDGCEFWDDRLKPKKVE
jgi:hypothetical protein